MSAMPNTTLQQSDSTGLPGARDIVRKLAAMLAGLVVAALLIRMLPGLEKLPEHITGADPAWMVAALIFEIASTVAFAFAFHGTYERRTSPRASASISMAVQGANIVLPAGGTGGLAVGAVILERAGIPRSFAASRTVALFLLTSLVSFLAIVLAGLGVATGLLAGDVTLVATLVPALGALALVAAVLALPRVVGEAAAESGGRVRRALASARIYLRDGVASSIDLVRTKDRLVIGGAVGYFAFDVAALAASFHALGVDGMPIGLLVLAYTLGHAGAIIPLPGSSEGGLIAMFVLYGAALAPATAAVLAYRVVHAGVPSVLGIVGAADVRRQLRGGRPHRAPARRSARAEQVHLGDVGLVTAG